MPRLPWWAQDLAGTDVIPSLLPAAPAAEERAATLEGLAGHRRLQRVQVGSRLGGGRSGGGRLSRGRPAGRPHPLGFCARKRHAAAAAAAELRGSPPILLLRAR